MWEGGIGNWGHYGRKYAMVKGAVHCMSETQSRTTWLLCITVITLNNSLKKKYKNNKKSIQCDLHRTVDAMMPKRRINF